MLALLFFVVCAVTGSMILLSATAAAGRLDGMKTTDQNYYAVRSAAKFIEKQLTKEHIRAEEKMTIVETTTTTVVDEVEQTEVTTSYRHEKPEFYHVAADGSEVKISSDVRSEDNILLYLLTDPLITYYDEKNVSTDSDEYPDAFNKEWFRSESDLSEEGKAGVSLNDTEIRVKSGSEEISELKVKMSVKLLPLGELSIQIINDDADDSGKLAKNEYSMLLKMKCENTPTSSEDTDTVHASEDETVETTTIIRKYDFTFTTTDIEKA